MKQIAKYANLTKEIWREAKPAAIVLIALLVGSVLLFLNKASRQGVAPGGVATPSPAAPGEFLRPPTLAPGKRVYRISTENYPRFTEASFDPLDAKVGQRQTVEVKVEDVNPIQGVTLTLTTDNTSQTYKLTLVGGSEYNGTWRGSWIMKDTHDIIYQALIQGESSRGRSSVDLRFR